MSNLIKREDTKCDKRNCPFVGAEDCKLQDCKYRTEQEVCEDAISREYLRTFFADDKGKGRHTPIDSLLALIDSAPSVTPQSCNDAISREWLLNELEDLNVAYFFELNEHSKEAYEAVKSMINVAPSVTPKVPKGEWIPCSERLPEENGDYIVTLENGYVTTRGYSTTQRTTYPKGFYYLENGFSWRQTQNPVIAWMPLPPCYQGE